MSDTLQFPIGSVIPQSGGMVQMGSDAFLTVTFYKRPVHNPHKSKMEGRPIYDKIDFVSIRQPGERDCVDRPATDHDKARFAAKWAAYEQALQPGEEGTPLALLFCGYEEVNIPPMLESLGVHTVEQLANLTATAIQNVGMGGQQWVNKAKSFLEKSVQGQSFHRLERENEQNRNKIAVLERQLSEAVQQINQLNAERMGQTGFPRGVMVPNYQNYVPQMTNPEVPTLPPLQFSTAPTDNAPSMEVLAPKRRGRPPGSKNKPQQET